MQPETFTTILTEALGRPPNPEQRECLEAGLTPPTFIVAGPGSGKTRVLVQRALRHVVVDRILPEQIVITTFTKKAAREIRSRLIQWGEPILDNVRKRAAADGDAELVAYLQRVDVNRFVTGTLDSLCEEALELSRTPAEPRYTLLDEFAARTLLARKGELNETRKTVPALDIFLSDFTLDGNPPFSTGDAARDLKSIADRVIHDLLDEKVFQDQSDAGRSAALAVVGRYDCHMNDTSQLDFARLERTILDRLRSGRHVGALSDARAVLVDEYQDTNLLQEQIYFELVRRQKAAFTVVGDDDQSLYRFRGATIELFRDFAGRAKSTFGCSSIKAIHLARNYRSTETIVTFFNRFIKNDQDFHPDARVKPLKPEIKPESGLPPFPILGIFRDDSQDLADAVSDFLAAVFSTGYKIPGTELILKKGANGGDFGDTVLLSKSVNEFGRPFMGNPPKPRLPYFLRLSLESKGIRVFNPRGRPVRDVESVQQLMGLILETIDPSSPSYPSGEISSGSDTFLRNDVKRVFGEWRQAAQTLLATNPSALNGKLLKAQLEEMRKLAKSGGQGPRDWPLLDVIYAYIPFIPKLSDDPEHQVYFEAVTRAAAQMVSFSGYRGLINRSPEHNVRSRRSALYDMLSPLAEGDIDVDEEILVSPPRSCFNLMTIHQAKGLEFPMVLVDVSSECKTDNAKQRFKRFPERPSGTTQIEDAFAKYTEIGSLRSKRTALQRSFEDIIREYYVAYSRPQSVLVLVGNRKALQTKTNIKHIGHFWRANKSWAWSDGLPPKKPPPIPNIPFEML